MAWRATWPSGVTAIALCVLALAGCKRGEQATEAGAALSAQQAAASAALDAVAAADSAAPVGCPGQPPGAGAHIDYGVLGDPERYRLDWIEDDEAFDCQSPKEKLALFRRHALHPRQGHPMVRWTLIEEDEAMQRALYYAVVKAAPRLITARDRRWLKTDEAALIDTACANRGETGVLFDVPEKDCPKAKR